MPSELTGPAQAGRNASVAEFTPSTISFSSLSSRAHVTGCAITRRSGCRWPAEGRDRVAQRHRPATRRRWRLVVAPSVVTTVCSLVCSLRSAAGCACGGFAGGVVSAQRCGAVVEPMDVGGHAAPAGSAVATRQPRDGAFDHRSCRRYSFCRSAFRAFVQAARRRAPGGRDMRRVGQNPHGCSSSSSRSRLSPTELEPEWSCGTRRRRHRATRDNGRSRLSTRRHVGVDQQTVGSQPCSCLEPGSQE